MSSVSPSKSPRTLTGASGQASVPPVAIFLLVLIAGIIGAGLYLFLDLRAARDESAERFQALEEQLAQIEGAINRTSRAVDTRVEEVKGLVEERGKQISARAQQAAQAALGKAETLQQELEQTKSRQQQALAEVGGRIQQLDETATQTTSRVGALSGRVEGVQEELTAARAELEQTLQSVRGDLGVQSGLIATNADELAALKRLGERDYFEFDLRESKNYTKVGRIQIRLRGTNEKRGMFTIDVLADDKTIRKKDKSLLEPVQFYVLGSKIPYEIVVNKMAKKTISGYLATPLDEAPRGATAGASAK